MPFWKKVKLKNLDNLYQESIYHPIKVSIYLCIEETVLSSHKRYKLNIL